MPETISDFSKLDKPYYVYALVDPRDGSVFYIGRGKKRSCGTRPERCRQHALAARCGDEMRNQKKYRKICKILKEGFTDVKYKFLAQADSSAEIDRLERQAISRFRKMWDLTNISDGGTGGIVWRGDHPNAGRVVSSETREKMRKAKLGKPGNRRGVRASEETKRRIRAARAKQSGDKEPRLCKLTEAQKKAILDARTSGLGRRKIAAATGVGAGVIQRFFRREHGVSV